MNTLELDSDAICLGQLQTNLHTNPKKLIFFLGQRTQGTWSLPPPSYLDISTSKMIQPLTVLT